MENTNIKAFGQVTLTDYTDSYSVHMTSEAHAFAGEGGHAKASATQTAIMAYQGINAVDCTVKVGTLPTGLTAKVTASGKTQIVTFTATTALTADGEATITVTINDPVVGALEYVKVFSWSIAFKGDTGIDGAPGADAILLQLTSSKGTVFKNSAIHTTLTAVVIQNGKTLSSDDMAALGAHLYWFLNDTDDADGVTYEYLSEFYDLTSIEVAMSDFVSTATYMCFLATEQPDPSTLA